MNDYTYYYTYDEPVEYKGLKIYPAQMKDYYYFHVLVDILLIDKNSMPDVKIIQMSYLDFLYSKHDETNKYIYKLDAILKLVMRDDEIDAKYGKDDKNRNCIKIKDEFYYSEDFDEIKRIICEYNGVDMIDESVSKEVRDKMRESEDLRIRTNNNKMASLEDQIVAVMISTSLKLEDIKNLSIRKFIKILERTDHKLHYEIYLSASMSGFVKFKDTSFIKHWLSDLRKDKLSGLVAYDDIKAKLNPVSV